VVGACKMSKKRRSMWKWAKYGFFVLLVLLALSWCFSGVIVTVLNQYSNLSDEDLKFRERIALRLSLIGKEVELRALVNRPWEKVCVVGPYNNVKDVESIFEIEFREEDVDWSRLDSYWGLVFIQKDEYFQILVLRDFGYDYVGEKMRCWQNNVDRPIVLVRKVANRESGFSLERGR